MANTYNYFDVKVEETVGVVTLNKPDTFNLISHALLLEMEQVQEEIENNQNIRAVVLCAQGSHFSYGTDLKSLRDRSPQATKRVLNRNQMIIHHWQEMPFPVVVAVQGRCFGGAVEIVLSCDIRILSEDCELTLPEVRLGLAPDLGGTTKLTKLVGLGQAKRIILGCETIKADEAYRIGMAEIVVPKEQLMERAMKLAKQMAGYPPQAIRFAKYGINLAAESSLKAGLLFEQAQSSANLNSADMQEALTAFFEKRPPVYQDK